MDKNGLNDREMRVSEVFYSIQGEGVSSGCPAVFVRLADCNLMCGGSDGKLMKEGTATWWCDSERLWRRGRVVSVEDVVDSIKTCAIDKMIPPRVVWTGGEPMLQRKAIAAAIDDLDFVSSSFYHELETNGTIDDIDFLDTELIDQINCSPKLENSGMPRKLRINEIAIRQIVYHHNGWFKFVVNEESDWDEIVRDFVEPFEIDPAKIILMPGVDNRAELAGWTRAVWEIAMKIGVRMCTRMQILAYDRRAGV